MKDLLADRMLRSALLPPNAFCEVCGESDPLKLDPDAATMLCADHSAIKRGQQPVESNHLARKPWPIVFDVSPNWHRIISALQRRWPKNSTFEGAVLRGIADLMRAIVDVLEHQPDGSKFLIGYLGESARRMHQAADSIDPRAISQR